MTTRVASMLLLSVAFAACTYVMPTPAPSTCGDGTADENETCDDGNDVDGDGCDSNCTPTECGNGIKTETEECDDGNNESGDECNANCKITICGDNLVQPGEECDDGNLTEGDKCDPNCTPPACGNGYKAANEVCDDANTNNGDGCDPTCTLTNTTSIVVGTLGTFGYADGVGTQAQLSGRPVMTLYGRTLYFSGANTIRALNLDTLAVTTIAGVGGMPGTADSSASGLDARFASIDGLATNGTTLWVADNDNHLLRSISLTPPYPVATEAGHTVSVGMYFQSIPGTGTQAEFDDLRGLVYHNNLLYMLDSDAGVVQTFDPTTKVVTSIAGYAYDLRVADGSAVDARFQGPRLMRLDSAGKLYISDADGSAIRIYDTDQKTVSTIAGPNCGHADGTGVDMKLYFPRGIALDGTSLFFTDPSAQTVRQLVLGPSILTTLSGVPQDCAVNCNCVNGTVGSYAPGIGKNALWNAPWDIIYDPDTKSLLVSDSENFVIRRIK